MARYHQPGVVVTDHRFTVPLDHDAPDGGQLELFGRVMDPLGAPQGGLHTRVLDKLCGRGGGPP
ncbi:hypothetical protein ACFW15_22405, partial [Streptomyces sp. NPDC058953]